MTRLLALALLLAPAAPAARPDAILCSLTYAAETTTVVALPTTDPYAVTPTSVLGRFDFRVVWIEAPAAAAGVNIYTHQPTPAGPVLLHQAKFRPPYAVVPVDATHGFTGLQLVYSPDQGRELQYWCAWRTP